MMYLHNGGCHVQSYKWLLKSSLSCFRTWNKKLSLLGNIPVRHARYDHKGLVPNVKNTVKRNCLTNSDISKYQYHKYNSHQKKYLLQRCTPSVNQCCHYHSISTVGQYDHHSPINTRKWSHRGGYRELLCPPLNSHITAVPKRHMSLAWLDSLAISQAGWFQSLAQSRLVEGLMTGLQAVHDTTHLPWWAAIILSTVLMRGVLTFPLAVYQVTVQFSFP